MKDELHITGIRNDDNWKRNVHRHHPISIWIPHNLAAARILLITPVKTLEKQCQNQTACDARTMRNKKLTMQAIVMKNIL